MTRFSVARLAAATALALGSTAALAASDAYLKIEGVEGESAVSEPQTIEVAAWSWGQSNPTSVGPGGLSSGKSGAPATEEVDAATSAPADQAASACAPGQHIRQAVLTADGRSYQLTDVVVLSCSTGADGMRKHELSGHVTLIR